MDNLTHYAKKIGIKELIIEKSHLSISHCFDANNGKIHSSFGFVKKGTVTLYFMGNQLRIPAGSLFYLPEGIRYNSIWSGEPDIEYYSIHMVSNKYDLPSRQNYTIQYIPEFSTPETEAIFDMDSLISELPDTYQTVIRQRFIYDRSYSEIAQLLGMSESAVRKRQERALKILRRKVKKFL